MKQTSGQSLNEFAILMAVIAVVCLAAYTALGNNINQLLSGSLTKFKGYDPTSFMKTKYGGTATSTSTPSTPSGTLASAGQWGGTPSSPVSNCVSGSCSIDFGNYILKGVPENLGQVVKSTGSSGANEKMYDLFMQLSDQLATEGKAAESQDFKDMANLAKYMASLQKINEDKAKSCIGSTNESDCIKAALASTSFISSVSIPSEISKFFTKLDSFSDDQGWQESYSIIGQGRFDKQSSFIYNDNQGKYPSYAFVDTFDKIMNSSNLSQNIKGIAKDLYLSVNDINQEFKFRKLGGSSDPFAIRQTMFPTYDPLTGAMIEMKSVSPQNFLTGEALSSSNLASSLSCSSINYLDNCHQKME